MTTMPQVANPKPTSSRAAPLIAARALSAAGASLASFATDVWVFKRTGSYGAFVTLLVLASVTTAILSPFAGKLVDTRHKGRLLLAADGASAFAILSAFAALRLDCLGLGVVGAVVLVLAAAETLRWPAFSASLSVLTPVAALPKANGMVEAARSATVVMGPLLGAAALASVGLDGVYSFNLALLAVSMLLTFAQCGLPALSARHPSSRGGSQGVAAAFRWVRTQPALARLLAFLAAVNCGLAIVSAAQTPYILSFGTPSLLSGYLALYGAGILCGGALFARVRTAAAGLTIGLCVTAQGAIILALGLSRTSAAVWVCGFMLGMVSSMLGAANQTVWQAMTPHSLQGRVFAVRAIIGSSAFPVALLASVPLVTHLFDPAIHEGPWAAGLARVWGAGPEGPLGLLLAMVGAWIATAVLVLQLGGGLPLDIAGRAGVAEPT